MLQRNYPYYPHEKLETLSELLDYGCEKYGKKTVFSFHQGEKIIRKSFIDYAKDVRNLSSYFYKNYKKKHIAVCGENSYEWLVTFMAIVISGNVCVPIDRDADAPLLKKLLRAADCDTLFYSEKYLPFVKDLSLKAEFKAEPLENTSEKITLGQKLQESIPQATKTHTANQKSQTTKYYTPHQVKKDDLAVIFFTSGTTGANKGVCLSENNIMSDIYGASSIYIPGGNTVNVLPFHHSFGLVTAILMPEYYGCETYICSSLKYFTKAMQLIHPETIFVVPAFIEAFYRQIWKTARKEHMDKKLKAALSVTSGLKHIGLDFRRTVAKKILNEFGGELKHIICGGAYLDPFYVKWFRKIGIEVLNGYGITECSPVLSVNRNNYHKDGTIGIPCRGAEIKIIDGEICAKGEMVMLGYYENGKILPPGDYFHTGDFGFIDSDGFVHITGRLKNTIILSNGENVSPETIESELLKDKGVREAVVYGENGGISAVIFPEEDRIGDEIYFENLRKRYNYNRPASRKLAKISLRTTEFVKNSSQKIIRSKIMEKNQ